VALYQPTIGQTGSTVTLSVTPIVSADRKYVTLAMSPNVTQLVSLASFPVYNVFTPASGGPAQVIQGQIQLPVTQTETVSTIVSVPDGGTLMLGGQTIAGESEYESGVPILSKIPILKRLFTNRSSAKDEAVLLILVKPTIIIRNEYEQNQFPNLNSRPVGR
jgi:type II secretory pathway component GspD/PulD (secretin)